MKRLGANHEVTALNRTSRPRARQRIMQERSRREAVEATKRNSKEAMLARFPHSMRRCIAIAVVGVVIVGACGGGGDGQDGSIPEPDNREVRPTVEVTAVDIAFPVPEYTAQAGTVRFVYRNDGQIRHTLVIEGVPAFDTLEVNRGRHRRGHGRTRTGDLHHLL